LAFFASKRTLQKKAESIQKSPCRAFLLSPMPPRKSLAITPQELNPPTTETLPAAPVADKITQAIIAAGIDPVSTVGMQEVKVIQEVFGGHLAALELLIPACQAVAEDDHVTAKKLALQVMRIRTTADKDRLAPNRRPSE
jgi:hypothetical protein